MKKLLVIGSLVLLGLLVIGSAFPVLAHTEDSEGTVAPGGISESHPTVVRLAEVLGLTPEALAGLLQEGNNLSEIAAEQGVAEEAVLETILAPHTSQIELRLEYGYLTQEQADAMLAEAEEHARLLLERDFSTVASYGDREEMEEYCGGMMSGWGGPAGFDGGMPHHGYGMMGYGGGHGMMGSWSSPADGWEESPRFRNYEETGRGGWGGMMGRFGNNLTPGSRGGGNMMGW